LASALTVLVDERQSTREAWQIIEHSAHRKVEKQEIDCIATVLITETWLKGAIKKPVQQSLQRY